MDFTVPADHREKLKVSEKKDQYLEFARELKKLWNIRVTIISIVVGAFGTVTKWLVKGLEDLEITGWVENIQTTALLRSARILRRVWKTWGDLLSLILQWKTQGVTFNRNKNSKCTLCCDRDKTNNPMKSECSKLAPREYKTRLDWARKMIP